MPLKDCSITDLEDLWIKLWFEMFNTLLESEEPPYETATVLQEFVRRINTELPQRMKDEQST